MDLLTLIQIPCHHVLANEIALNLKYRIDLKQIFIINLEIGIIKKTIFLFIFSTYLLVFLLKFWSALDAKLNSSSNEYLLGILLTGTTTQKQEILEKTWWWYHHHVFPSISCFWGSRACQKYSKWVLVGWGI